MTASQKKQTCYEVLKHNMRVSSHYSNKSRPAFYTKRLRSIRTFEKVLLYASIRGWIVLPQLILYLCGLSLSRFGLVYE